MTVKTVKNCSLKTEYWKIDYIEDITMSKPRIKTSKDLMLSNKSKKKLCGNTRIIQSMIAHKLNEENQVKRDWFLQTYRLSYVGRRADALALRAEERRDKLRKATGRGKYLKIRRYLNGETHYRRAIVPLTESIG